MANKIKVYLSGGFSSNWQKEIIERLQDHFVFFNPRAHDLKAHTLYLTWDLHFLKECDIVFAYMEKTNPSGYGLSFELGIASALNKTIILVDEKSAVDPQFEKHFKIVHPVTSAVFKTLEEGIEYLKIFFIN